MTAAEAIAWSAGKAAAVGLLAVPFAKPPRAVWAVLLLAFAAVTPSLLPGYAYRGEALRWVNERWRTDLLHAAVCWGRFLPWAVLVSWLVGRGDVSRPAAVWSLTAGRRSALAHHLGRCRLWLTAHAGPACGGLAAAWLTFTESEVAGLLQARGWPEWVLRRLAGGVPPGDVVASLWPVAAVVVALAAAVWFVRSQADGETVREDRGGSVWPAVVAVLIVAGVPAARLTGDAVDGLAAITRQPKVAAELLRTVAIAAVVATAVRWWASLAMNGRRAGWLLPAGLGLVGPLLAAVAVQAACGRLGLGRLLWTPVPHVLTLAAVVMPTAVVLAAAVRRLEDRGLSAARQLTRHPDAAVRRRAESHVWRRSTGPRAAAWSLLFLVAFWDLLVASTLHAAGWATLPGRLYNLAHYGQSDALAAILFAAVAASAAVAGGRVAASKV